MLMQEVLNHMGSVAQLPFEEQLPKLPTRTLISMLRDLIGSGMAGKARSSQRTAELDKRRGR